MNRRIALVCVLVLGCAAGFLVSCNVWFMPSLDFEASTLEGLEPLVVQFSPVSDETMVSCTWTFGDGETSSDVEPVHIYRSAGTYTVTLTAEFVDGTVATVEKPDLVNVGVLLGKVEPDYIYWIDWSYGGRGIWRGLRSGGEKEKVIALEGFFPTPEALAVADGWVYWPNGANYSICRARTDGSDRETLLDDQYYVSDLEVVPEANAILWVTCPIDSPSIGKHYGGIYLAFLDDLEPQTLVSHKPDAEWFADQLEVDAAGGKIYWSVYHFSGCSASIQVSDVSGFAPGPLQSGLCTVYGFALGTMTDYEADYVYWTHLDGWICRCKTDGTGKEQLFHDAGAPTLLAVDRLEGKMYYPTGRGIERANLDGSGQEVIYPGGLITAIALPE